MEQFKMLLYLSSTSTNQLYVLSAMLSLSLVGDNIYIPKEGVSSWVTRAGG